MTRNSKRSQAQQKRFQQQRASQNAASTVSANGSNPENVSPVPVRTGDRRNEMSTTKVTDAVEMSTPSAAKSSETQVKHGGQRFSSCTQQVHNSGPLTSGCQHDTNRGSSHMQELSCKGNTGDLKRGCQINNIAGPADVTQRTKPSETSVCASRSQAARMYGRNSNKQCTCNSLTFLAFLHESESVTKADLNLVLDKGNVMYQRVRETLGPDSYDYLTTDELPENIPARHCTFHADKETLSRYGTFGEPPVGAVDSYLDLQSALSCLLTDVQYALLIMASLCIAVFRTRSGRYGFFDPHSRGANGLPLNSGKTGTAVMVTFTHLSDMITRLQQCYRQLGIRDEMQYELKPVEFYAEGTSNIRDSIRDTECRPQTTAVNEQVIKSALTTLCDDTFSESSTNITNTSLPTEALLLSHIQPEPTPPKTVANVASDCESKISSSNNPSTVPDAVFQAISNKFSKRNKLEKSKIKKRLLALEKQWQTRDNQQTNQGKDAVDNAKSEGVLNQTEISFRVRRREYMRKLYRDNAEVRHRKCQYAAKRYRENFDLQQNKKQSYKKLYADNSEFRCKRKDYMTTRYKKDSDFQQRRKQYITMRYQEDEAFRSRQKKYITKRYQDDEIFRSYQRKYVTTNYAHSEEYRRRQKSYISQRFTNDPVFNKRHKQKMRQVMRDRYQMDVAFRRMHKLRCAMNIKRKYRHIQRQPHHKDNSVNQPQQQNNSVNQPQQQENSVIVKAISVFRRQIRAGPTHVCTVCHKASFPNQVKVCNRSHYKKNPLIVAACLTGKYVHHCDDSCRNGQQCNIPEERKKEWICHTCHDHLRRGAMPSLAVANNLKLVDIPPELSELNILERHLISRCIPFAKIIPLPKGRQRAIRGNVVCVPSETQETVEALPRLRSDSQVLRVKLKRRLCYRGHQIFQTVTWSKLMQALHKLKEIHPQYSDITIRDEPELCDPTIPDDDSDEEEDTRMEEDNYDDADLMEIDDFEKQAMCEPENESVNDEDNNMLSCDAEQRDDAEQEGDMPNGGFALESCLQPPNVAEEILSFSEGIYSVAPAERNSPVGFFRTPKLEAMAFPVQFPTGQNTLDETRTKKLSPSSYFKARLFSIDDRFARDCNYLFFAQFVIEVHLAKSSMTIQLKKGKAMTRDGRKITSGMLQDKHEVEKLVRNREACRFMRALRGTPAYWHQKTQELFAMLRQLGTPTFFCTFSAAEMRWPEVIEAIKRQQGEQVNFDELNWSEKCDILRSNPVTAMRMFDKRVEALFRDLLLAPADPLSKVLDFFYRVEFQHRGSPHIHCLLWVLGAPVFEKDDEQTICDFVSRYITAQLPDPQKEPELYKKVTEVQKHSRTHTKSCFKSAMSGCRFGFPKPPCRQTMISTACEAQDMESAKRKLTPLRKLLNEPEAASMTLDQLLAQCDLTMDEYELYLQNMYKSSTLILKRDPKDCWINAYNPHLLTAWDANIDVSYILNPYACIQYLTKYITKKEAGLSEYLKTVIDNSNTTNVNECDEMKAVMQAYSKKREISAQECVARACGLNMKKCSRAVVFIATDDNPLRMSRPLSYLENTTSECTNVWMTSLTDKYKSRPETPEFETMCMADFAATCRFVSDGKGKDVFPLLNDMGFVKRRRDEKPAIIRYYRASQEKYPEQYYRGLLALYLPHRSDMELKRSSFPTYQSFYTSGLVRLKGSDHVQSVHDIVTENRKKYEKNSEEIEKAVEMFEQDNGEMDEWCNLAPESEVVRLDHHDIVQEADPHHDDEQENVPNYTRETAAVSEARAVREPPAMDPAVLRQMFQSLNQQQARVFYAVRDWCIQRVCGLDPDQFFFYINGGAGTGKSHLIKCVHSEASKILSKLPRHCEEADISKPSVLLTAFTGTAAFNISGTTLHSLLKLPRSLKPPIQGLGNKLDEVRVELMNAQIIIIDEVSMVSKPLFVYVDARLKQIMGCQRPFGGMSVIAVGDFYQLPPVRQSQPLCVYDPSEMDLWQEHFQMVTLTEIMRQKDDVAFAELLNRIRVKGKTDELSETDRALISQAVTEPALCPTDVLHIFATNKQVDAHNSATLAKMHVNVINIHADDFQKDPQSGRMVRRDSPHKGGRNELADTLQVAEGARVMLTRNIDVRNGLVNGAFGKLLRIVTSDTDHHVTRLGLRMDNDTAGRNSGQADSLVYIEREEEQLKQRGVVRRQFPIKLAFACTIHKVQGMTTTSAVVSLKSIFEPGMAYVAVSRVTSLSGLHILDLDESKIYANQQVTAALETMRQASLGDLMPLLQVRETLSRPDTLTIVHHNTEGLPAHVNDIRSHHELCLADILCLTETHLQGSFVADSLQLQGYNMFKRNRHLSYTKHPEMASRGGGGVAVYVRSHIQVREKQYLHNVTDLEFVALKVEAPQSAVIAAVYRPPNYNVTSFLSNLRSLLDSLEILDCHPIIVCGDFNENLSSTARKPILELFQSRGYAQLITAATTDKNTLLDLIFISQANLCVHSGVLKAYHSYHNPVYCVLSFSRS